MSTTLPTRVDRVTFEIVRHRLWSINEEAGHTLERVSGSLIASEVHDMNTSLMNAQGDSLVLAPYMLVHAISMETLAKDVVANYQENPGIGPDDMFLSNDPYVGAQHQMDVVVLGAIHWQGELIGWSAARSIRSTWAVPCLARSRWAPGTSTANSRCFRR